MGFVKKEFHLIKTNYFPTIKAPHGAISLIYSEPQAMVYTDRNGKTKMFAHSEKCGNAVLIHRNGYYLTAAHCIKNQKLSYHIHNALVETIYIWKDRDIALVKADNKTIKCRPAKIFNKTSSLYLLAVAFSPSYDMSQSSLKKFKSIMTYAFNDEIVIQPIKPKQIIGSGSSGGGIFSVNGSLCAIITRDSENVSDFKKNEALLLANKTMKAFFPKLWSENTVPHVTFASRIDTLSPKIKLFLK